jgi:glycosyltransferase involved in cell wall biosynthesis
MRILVLYRDSPERRRSLAAPAGAPERYLLHGLDALGDPGDEIRHSLEPDLTPGAPHRFVGRRVNRLLAATGGYGGDFATACACRKLANRSDVVLSTVDTAGLPLMLLHALRLVRVPTVYIAIGLPERLRKLRNRPQRMFYRRALSRASTVIAFGHAEADELRRWFGPSGPPVVFLPFGVDTNAIAPGRAVTTTTDVISVGADPHRDYDLLLATAGRHPERSFVIVTSGGRAAGLPPAPNVLVESDLLHTDVLDRMRAARVVALPVRDNTYSGATTTLLQALSLGRPVVVSRTAAIAEGYGLEDGVHCRLVPPGDAESFEKAVTELLGDPEAADALGRAGRALVEQQLSWESYVEGLRSVIRSAAAERAVR